MAQKDWKKVKSIETKERIVFKNKKTEGYLDIIQVYPVVPLGMGGMYKPMWKVRTPQRKYHKNFKTKSAALKFAKSYMRRD